MDYNTIEELRTDLEALPNLKLKTSPRSGRKQNTPYITGITPDMIKGMTDHGLLAENQWAGVGEDPILISDILDFVEEYPQVSIIGFIDFEESIFLIEGIEYTGNVSEDMRNDFIRCFHRADYFEAKRSYLLFMAY